RVSLSPTVANIPVGKWEIPEGPASDLGFRVGCVEALNLTLTMILTPRLPPRTSMPHGRE
ncbi:hypothetical protein, partial [Roseibium hamelinense]|uniref:hypothetical protein n=1 Tax=Roseibium hamelinense TaxID=150831 RepID=UPI001AD8B866